MKWRWPRLKLRWQLLLSYLPVMLAPVLLIGLVVRSAAEQGMTVLVTQQAQRRAVAISRVFTQYYAINGNWIGIETLFDEFRPGPNQLRFPFSLEVDNPPDAAPPPAR